MKAEIGSGAAPATGELGAGDAPEADAGTVDGDATEEGKA